MPTVHLLCGLPASGKTTIARRLERDHQAVRFTLDEWMLTLFDDLTPYDDEYGVRADRVKELIWRTAERVLGVGRDVVLDWSQWNSEAREAARRRAVSLGAEPLLHYIDAPMSVVEGRLAERNAQAIPGVHQLDLDEVRRFATQLFESPSRDEAVSTVIETTPCHPMAYRDENRQERAAHLDALRLSEHFPRRATG